MNGIVLGQTKMQECPKCQGLWVDAATLEQIYAERERQVAVIGMAEPTTVQAGAVEEKVRYLPCPVCRKLMNRVNFAQYSNVIVDVCKGHGTWFDRDELRRVIEFIRAGGLDEARSRKLKELDERERRVSAAQTDTPWTSDPMEQDFNLNRHSGISLVADALIDFFRRD